MRPKYLEIEGLQSFKNIQPIDFDKLSETGLFGIFGPTGSGKSTILDAITLALYGRVQRAPSSKTQGVMNTDMQTAKVIFTFELSRDNTRKVYRVERNFKRKKDSETAMEAKVARLIEITPHGEIVIVDKAGEVTERIIQLLGIEFDDFTRTVVLPQNKFQEFLTLPKNERRQMLEKIFFLEEYGEQLKKKLSKKVSAVTHVLSNLEGQMATLGDASEIALIEAERKMQETLKLKEKADTDLKEAELKYSEAKEVWELILELESTNTVLQDHLSKQESVNLKKALYEKALKAEGITDYINTYRQAAQSLQKTELELEKVNTEIEVLEKELQKVQKDYAEKTTARKEEIPRLVEYKTKLEGALKDKEEITRIQERLNILREDYVKLKKEIDEKEKAMAACKEELDEKDQTLRQCKKTMENIKTDADYRKQVQQGLELEQELRKAEKDQAVSRQKRADMQEKVTILQQALQKLTEQGQSLKQNIEALKVQQAAHETAKPGDRGQVMEEERHYHSLKSLWEALKQKRSESDKYEGKQAELTAQVTKQQETYSRWAAQKSILEEKLTTLNKELEEQKSLYEKNTAFILAQTLKSGDPCPVCGSPDHPHPASESQGVRIGEIEQAMSKLQEVREDLEKEHKAAGDECIKLEAQIRSLNEQQRQIQEELEAKQGEYTSLKEKIPQTMQSMDLSQIEVHLNKIKTDSERKLEAISHWETLAEAQKAKLLEQEDSLSRHQIIESGKKAEAEVIKSNLVSAEAEFAEAQKGLEEKQVRHQAFTRQIGIQSAAAEIEKIEKNDREIEKLQKQAETLEKSAETLRSRIEVLQTEKQQTAERFADVDAEGRGLKAQKEEKEQKINVVTAGKDISSEIAAADHRIKALEQEEQEAEVYLKAVTDKHQKAKTNKNTLSNQKEIYTKSLNTEANRLQAALTEKGFTAIEEAEAAALPKEQREKLDTEIKAFEEYVKSLQAQMDMVGKKLKGRTITKEAWQQIGIQWEAQKGQKEEAIAQFESAKNKYHTIKENCERWVKLHKEKQAYERKKEMLEQIQKLLKGNGFIEFISEERLRYIAKEASETLGLLTKYRYALELDTENGFVIRDNANGGVHRMVSTLSGGETFLTSLSLALALSSQIQLKGQSPLEFFFLDEGFGTLDNSLLDTVIDSLERLSTTQRVIGLISHVPELKSRITRRLVVEPPTSAGQGSRVRIEKA